jgi:putative spermidine/putrescine transport system permease protein/mannopine transport system permease protein
MRSPIVPADGVLPIPFLAPALIFMTAIFLTPLIFVVYTSVAGDHGFSLAYYVQIATQPLYRRVIENSLEISIMATLCTLVVAYPIAYDLAHRPPRQRSLFVILVLLPFWTSILVKSFAFTVLLGRGGIINRLIGVLGFAPIPLLFNRTGVMIGLMHYLVPFMVFAILPSLLSQPSELRQAAEVMGAGSLRIFCTVTLPLSLPGIVAGVLLCFILTLGTFVTPALLGGRTDLMIANLIDFNIHETLNWGVGSALAIALAGITAICALALGWLRGGNLFGQS